MSEGDGQIRRETDKPTQTHTQNGRQTTVRPTDIGTARERDRQKQKQTDRQIDGDRQTERQAER